MPLDQNNPFSMTTAFKWILGIYMNTNNKTTVQDSEKHNNVQFVYVNQITQQ